MAENNILGIYYFYLFVKGKKKTFTFSLDIKIFSKSTHAFGRVGGRGGSDEKMGGQDISISFESRTASSKLSRFYSLLKHVQEVSLMWCPIICTVTLEVGYYTIGKILLANFVS